MHSFCAGQDKTALSVFRALRQVAEVDKIEKHSTKVNINNRVKAFIKNPLNIYLKCKEVARFFTVKKFVFFELNFFF